MRIRDPGWENSDPGWEKFRSGIRDGKNSDPGSGINIRNTAESHGNPDCFYLRVICLFSNLIRDTVHIKLANIINFAEYYVFLLRTSK
jgi:hypothetical protein